MIKKLLFVTEQDKFFYSKFNNIDWDIANKPSDHKLLQFVITARQ